MRIYYQELEDCSPELCIYRLSHSLLYTTPKEVELWNLQLWQPRHSCALCHTVIITKCHRAAAWHPYKATPRRFTWVCDVMWGVLIDTFQTNAVSLPTLDFSKLLFLGLLCTMPLKSWKSFVLIQNNIWLVVKFANQSERSKASSTLIGGW